MTNDLAVRLNQHFEHRGKPETFAGRYYCYNLVYCEHCTDVNFTIQREKEIKDMSRVAKIALIKSVNPQMKFLTQEAWKF
jgi:putative endonuclease